MSEDLFLFWVACDEEVCFEDCDFNENGNHRVVEWWGERCEGCEDFWCEFHNTHAADCSCVLDIYIPDRLWPNNVRDTR